MASSKLIDILTGTKPAAARRLAIMAGLAGLLQALVVVIINLGAKKIGQGLDTRTLLMFAVCITGFIIAKRLTLFGSARCIYGIVYDLRLDLVDKIRKARLQSFEGIGAENIVGLLTQNTEVIIEAAKALSHAFSAAVMLFFSFIYILVLSPQAFFLTVGLLAAGVHVYLSANTKIRPKIRQANQVENRFHGLLAQLLNGFKEVKMSPEKSRDLFENAIRANSETARSQKLAAEYLLIGNNFFVQVFFFLLIAAVVFILPQFGGQNLGMYRDLIAVLLFCIGSIVSVVQVIPILSKADAALNDLHELAETLAGADDEKAAAPEPPPAAGEPLRGIELKGLRFNYAGEEGRQGFGLGPLDLRLLPGKAVFLTGGNGGGKSTLLKLVAGLYHPQAGQILWNGAEVTEENQAHYRKLFSVIFTDFHLFDRLYGLPPQDPAEVERLLARMQLDHATAFKGDRFSRLNLSTGQKKRLAIIAAYLEARPVFLFDEVAADQDPGFREYFYTVLLKEMTGQGKAVIIATHDERYFHLADLCLKMEFGQLVDR